MERPFSNGSWPARLGLTIVVVGVLACGQTTPSPSSSDVPTASTSASASSDANPSPSATVSAVPSASQDPNAIFDAIERQVADLRGLQPTAKVQREIIDETQLRAIVTADFDKQNPSATVAAVDRLYKALGLLPATGDVRQSELDFLSGGVAGFYKDDEKKMFVVSRSGAITPADRVTYAHEYTHALQDQHFSVFKDQKDVKDRGDWLVARSAVYEGDASVVMTFWAQANLTPAELLSVLTVDPAAQKILDDAPPILRDVVNFQYLTGATFTLSAETTGGWPAVDAFYDRLPTSTEQVLHPDAYAQDAKPVDVQLPATLAKTLGTGWTTPLIDTFGELQTRIWLKGAGVADPAATDAAAGWGGDRIEVIEGPGGAWAVAWHTTWDTTADAAAFDTAATTALKTAGGIAQVVPGAGGLDRWILVGGDAATLSHVAAVLGLAG